MLRSFFFFLLAFTLLQARDSFIIDHATVSIYAVHSETGEVLIDQNSDLSLIPSSCMKIATTGAALHLLDPKSRFKTDLEYDGYIDAMGTLRGNLYITGGGDPCLGSNRIQGSLPWNKQIETWADAIEKKGIKKIKGTIIGDASHWEKALAAPSWSWEDLGNYYGAGACALSFHENCYALFFQPGNQIGEKTTILRTEPPIQLAFQNEVTTGPKGSGDCAFIFGAEFSPLYFVRGTIPAGTTEFPIKGAIPDPPSYCAELLAKELHKRGFLIGTRESFSTKQRVKFHTTKSPTIAEIVHWTNQKSINLYAEHLLKKMGEVGFGDGSTSGGIKALTQFWKKQKIDLEGFNMADGSGLSRKNLITTKQLVEMLLVMKKSKVFPLFFDSLTKKQGCRVKSGSMSFIRGYAGYSGNVVFAVIVNQFPNHQQMDEKLDSLLSRLESISHAF